MLSSVQHGQGLESSPGSVGTIAIEITLLASFVKIGADLLLYKEKGKLFRISKISTRWFFALLCWDSAFLFFAHPCSLDHFLFSKHSS